MLERITNYKFSFTEVLIPAPVYITQCLLALISRANSSRRELTMSDESKYSVISSLLRAVEAMI